MTLTACIALASASLCRQGISDQKIGFVSLPRPPRDARIERTSNQSAVEIKVGAKSAAACRAAANCGGNSFPLLPARRRMPLQAVALKKYRRGTSPVSKMSDNEHAAAPLWNSKELSVKGSIGPPIPEFAQAPEEGTKVPSFVARQDAGDVLPNQPLGPQSASKRKELKGEVATVASHSRSESGDAEILAWGSAHENVDWVIFALFDRGEIAMQRRVAPMVFENGARERFDLRQETRPPAQAVPRHAGRFDPAANATVPHHVPFSRGASVASLARSLLAADRPKQLSPSRLEPSAFSCEPRLVGGFFRLVMRRLFTGSNVSHHFGNSFLSKQFEQCFLPLIGSAVKMVDTNHHGDQRGVDRSAFPYLCIVPFAASKWRRFVSDPQIIDDATARMAERAIFAIQCFEAITFGHARLLCDQVSEAVNKKVDSKSNYCHGGNDERPPFGVNFERLYRAHADRIVTRNICVAQRKIDRVDCGFTHAASSLFG
jgi:hypothetical protein